MRKISFLLFFVFSSAVAQEIDKLNKRELKELANNQKEQIIIKNSQINDQNLIIENSSEKIKELNQIKAQLEISLSESEKNLKVLESYKLSSIDSIQKLNAENAVIPNLENEIIKLTDSINSINNLLSSYVSQGPSNVNQSSVSTNYGFLNNLYLGYSQIENQTFRLVPAGIIAENKLNNNSRNDYNDYGYRIPQFISMSELKIGIQEKKKTYLSYRNDVQNFKQLIKDNYKMVAGSNLYNLYPKLFPTFSFVKGKLLTITNENISKDFLFSIKEKNTEDDLENQLGQKGKYFSLTDDDEREYLLELILINDEVYLTFNFDDYNDYNDLAKLGVKWGVTSNYESKLVRYYGNGYTATAKINNNDGALMNSNYDYNTSKYTYFLYEDSDYFLECDKMYMSIWLIPTIYESQVRVNPGIFLFKLEEI
jgi:hypothetical protein